MWGGGGAGGVRGVDGRGRCAGGLWGRGGGIWRTFVCTCPRCTYSFPTPLHPTPPHVFHPPLLSHLLSHSLPSTSHPSPSPHPPPPSLTYLLPPPFPLSSLSLSSLAPPAPADTDAETEEELYSLMDRTQTAFSRLALANTARTAALLGGAEALAFWSLEILKDQAEAALRFVQRWVYE